MDITKFMETLSELIMTEMEGVLKSSIAYEDGEAEEIVVLLDNETKLKIVVSKYRKKRRTKNE